MLYQAWDKTAPGDFPDETKLHASIISSHITFEINFSLIL